ncbi:MAG: envelope stress sensor histidine kinase CpxA [Chloroflexota bacterium]
MTRPIRLINRISRWSALLIFISITAIVVGTSLATSTALDAEAQSSVDARLRTRIERTATRIAVGKDPTKQLSAVGSDIRGVQFAWIGRDGDLVSSSIATDHLESLRELIARAQAGISIESRQVSLNGIAVAVRVGTQRLSDGSTLVALSSSPRNVEPEGDVLRRTLLLFALSAGGAGCVYVLLRFTAFRPLDRVLKREQRLIADASHEMRTTAAVISAGIELLAERRAVNPAQQQLLGDLRSESQRLNRMVRDLLTRSSLPLESTQSEGNSADLQTIIEHALRRAILIAPKHVRFEEALPVKSLKQISVSRDLLDSALDALLENAAHHAVSRVLVNCAIDDGVVNIFIDDDGSGVPLPLRESIMQPFARVESNRGTSGAGLGLAIASAAAGQLGGQLSIEDSPLGGARLRLQFVPVQPVKNVTSKS